MAQALDEVAPLRADLPYEELLRLVGPTRHSAFPVVDGDSVTGILSGSLQKVTIDRVLRLVDAAGLEANIRVRRAA